MRIGEALFAGSLAVLAGPVAPELPDNVDPVFATAYNGCVSALNNGGFIAEGEGWISHDSGDPDSQLWDNHTHGFATKDVPAGGLNLSASVSTAEGYELGECSVGMREPKQPIVAPYLLTAGLTGKVETFEDGWSGSWRDKDAKFFIQARLSAEADSFKFAMTRVVKTQ
jgi:hypothetical protein